MMPEIQPTSTHTRPALTFLLDVDNTLLDNDRLKSDIGERIQQLVGDSGADRFWSIYEQVRTKEDYVDYPTAVAQYGEECGDSTLTQRLWNVLESMDFPSYVYPGARETISHFKELGTVVILSDGDHVFQPLKIKQSGLQAAVDDHVLIFVHKEQELPKVFAAYPADHYVVVDDKSRILSVLEECCPSTFTTVHVKQGHYAEEDGFFPKPDYIVPAIADLLKFTASQFQPGATS